MPPVTPRRMCLPCMGARLRSRRLSHRALRRVQTGGEEWEIAPIRALSAPRPPRLAFLRLIPQRLEPEVMSIRHWPAAERPREKLLERGAQALSDAELLALLLGAGNRGHSAVELARSLISQFGSLRTLLNADAARCLAQEGIGPARYAILKAALELARRHFREALRVGPTLAAPDATRTFLNAQLRDRPYEVFCCLYLLMKCNVLIDIAICNRKWPWSVSGPSERQNISDW